MKKALLTLRGLARASPTLDPNPNPPSISTKARSTFGKVKPPPPIGPTTPAPVPPTASFGFRNAPRGSRSGFFEFSS